MNQDIIKAYDISEDEIKSALKMIARGEGLTVVAYELGLGDFRESEQDSIITRLGIFDDAC